MRLAHRLLVVIACLQAMTIVDPAGAADPYADAVAQSKVDALAPAYREWYLQTMRPSFSAFFQPLASRCIEEAPLRDKETLGLVFTVTRDGRVKQILWATRTPFTNCLQTSLRTKVFPRAPKDEFYFGLQLDFKNQGKGVGST